MQYRKVKLTAVSLLVLGIIELQAQNVIPSSSGNALGSGGSVSYSVGQVVYTTNTSTSGSVAQGVQQPYEISVITGIEQAKNIILVCSVYPNPVRDFLILKIENYDIQNLLYQLYDNRSILLENKKITGNETAISMVNHISGTYFLKILGSQKEIKTFKIIKY